MNNSGGSMGPLMPTTQSAGTAIGAALAGVAANSAGMATAVSMADVKLAIVPTNTVEVPKTKKGPE